MDVRAPGIGALSPDGKSLYFSWSITGIGQIWRVDGPRHFPQQVTGGEDSTALAAITPDGRILVIQRDRKGEENPGLYLQPVAGGPLETHPARARRANALRGRVERLAVRVFHGQRSEARRVRRLPMGPGEEGAARSSSTRRARLRRQGSPPAPAAGLLARLRSQGRRASPASQRDRLGDGRVLRVGSRQPHADPAARPGRDWRSTTRAMARARVSSSS